MIKSIPFLTLCLAGILFQSCNTSNVELELTSKERNWVDSVFRVELKAMQQEVDSICAAKKTARYQQLKDSFIQVRMREIESMKLN